MRACDWSSPRIPDQASNDSTEGHRSSSVSYARLKKSESGISAPHNLHGLSPDKTFRDKPGKTQSTVKGLEGLNHLGCWNHLKKPVFLVALPFRMKRVGHFEKI